jgi:hypothetical protein
MEHIPLKNMTDSYILSWYNDSLYMPVQFLYHITELIICSLFLNILGDGRTWVAYVPSIPVFFLI